MKSIYAFSLSLITLLAVSSAYAIDRNADMIDAVKLEGASYRNSDYAGLRITGENRVADSSGKWAILAALAGGQLSLDAGPEMDAIEVGLGLKFYLTSLTSISGMVRYTWLEDVIDFEVGAFDVSIKQRLINASRPISPYFKIGAGIQAVDTDDSYEVLVLTASAGCDFMMNESMAFVFEAGISESEDVDKGSDREDGFHVGIAMQYYWE
jgi:hypothetical protein